jgi:hypothetical protein
MNSRHPDRVILSVYVWRGLKAAVKREGDISEFMRQAVVRELKRRGRRISKGWVE